MRFPVFSDDCSVLIDYTYANLVDMSSEGDVNMILSENGDKHLTSNSFVLFTIVFSILESWKIQS